MHAYVDGKEVKREVKREREVDYAASYAGPLLLGLGFLGGYRSPECSGVGSPIIRRHQI